MYLVIVTEPAEQDMTEAAIYIAEKLHNLPAANRLLDEVDKAIFSLEEMPHRHSLVNDDYLASLGMRFFPVRNYLVFYTIQEEYETVEIERFIYSKRDWSAILKGREDDDNPYPTL